MLSCLCSISFPLLSLAVELSGQSQGQSWRHLQDSGTGKHICGQVKLSPEPVHRELCWKLYPDCWLALDVTHYIVLQVCIAKQTTLCVHICMHNNNPEAWMVCNESVSWLFLVVHYVHIEGNKSDAEGGPVGEWLFIVVLLYRCWFLQSINTHWWKKRVRAALGHSWSRKVLLYSNTADLRVCSTLMDVFHI